MNLETGLQALNEKKSACQTDSPARERITALFDEGTFVEVDAFAADAGVITGYGKIEGAMVYAFSQDVQAMGGAINAAHAEKIAKIYALAAKNGVPVAGIYDSNGAKISDGQKVMAAFTKIIASITALSGVVPQIAVAAGSCVGSCAMLAAAADILIVAEDATVYLSSPDGNTSGKDAAECGAADIVCEDALSAVLKARELLSVLPLNNLSMAPVCDGDMAYTYDSSADLKKTAKDVCDEGTFVELKAGYTSAVTGIGSIGGVGVGVVAACGTLGVEGSEKIARFVRFCDCFNLPVVTFVDTEGFCKKNPKKAVVADAAATLAKAYASATSPLIALFAGKAVGTAFAVFSTCDYKIAWPTATISALDPAAAVEFFWHDRLKGAENTEATRKALEEEYASTEASAFAAAGASLVEEVIDPAATKTSLIAALDMLASKRAVGLPKKHIN